jgi:hypothetical protein
LRASISASSCATNACRDDGSSADEEDGGEDDEDDEDDDDDDDDDDEEEEEEEEEEDGAPGERPKASKSARILHNTPTNRADRASSVASLANR